jgi:hypothetical protein
MGVQHVVLFQFPAPLSEEDERQMHAMVAEWPKAIGGFTKLRLGVDLNEGERAQGYQYLLHSEHPDEAGLRAYQADPVHQEFSRWVHARECRVLAFDYELDSTTVLVGDEAADPAQRGMQ